MAIAVYHVPILREHLKKYSVGLGRIMTGIPTFDNIKLEVDLWQ